MIRHRTFHVLLIVAVAALLAAGCGGDGAAPLSKDDYAAALSDTSKELAENDAVTGEGEPNPDRFRAGAKALESASMKMDELEPPTEVAVLHEEYVAGLSEYGAALGALAGSATATPDEITKLQGDLEAASKKLGGAIQGLDEKGYDAG